MLSRSSLVECDSVLHGNRCLQSVEFFFLRQYVWPSLLKNPKYTFYTIKSSLKLAKYINEFKNTYVVESWLIVYFKKEKHGELRGS
jgi:CTP:phosphocholine cytidylyltransferase-like protein